MGNVAQDSICLGLITGAHGVRGEVRLKSFCATPSDIADYGPFLTAKGDSLSLQLVKPAKDGFIAQIKGVRTRNEAEALAKTFLYVPRARLPETEEDEFYYEDLIRLQALSLTGAPLGRVKAVLNHGAGDILELQTPNGITLIPFTKAHVPHIDLAAGQLLIDMPNEAGDQEEHQGHDQDGPTDD